MVQRFKPTQWKVPKRTASSTGVFIPGVKFELGCGLASHMVREMFGEVEERAELGSSSSELVDAMFPLSRESVMQRLLGHNCHFRRTFPPTNIRNLQDSQLGH